MSIGRIGGIIGSNTILSTYRYIAAGSETSLSGADSGGNTLIYPQNYEAVFLNGVRLARGLDYQATTGTSITGLSALSADDIIEIVVFQNLDVVSVDYADVRFAADAPSNPVNGTVWIDSDATVNVADYALTENPTFTGVVSVADGSVTAPSITNTGDSDTGIYFPADNTLAISSGGSPRVQISPSGSTFPASARFESTINSISTSSPQTAITVAHYSDSGVARLIFFDKGRGTESSPAVVQSGDLLGTIRFRGYSAAAGGMLNAAEIRSFVDGTPDTSGDTTDMPGGLSFLTTPDGNSGVAERMRIDNNGRIQIPAGGILEAPISTNAQTTSYTLVLGDAGRLIEINNAGATTLTIPADASVNFPVGTKIDVLQTGAGQVTIAGSGFTPNATPGLKISAQWGAATLIKRGTNSWVVIGNLSA